LHDHEETLRRADPSEYPDLAALHVRTALTAFRDIFPPSAPKPLLAEEIEGWRRLLGNDPARTAAFVIGPPGAVEGVAVARLDSDDGPTGNVERVYVDPGHWRHGHGSRLLDAALAWLGAAGCTGAELWTLERNSLSRSWYERRGWQLVDGRLDIWPEGGIVDVRYRRALP
jgi:GNAT superfamily N-acetyltransferase